MTQLGALAIGAAIGVLTGMFGVGGGFLITPVLNIVLGLPMNLAVGTGAMQIVGVTTAGLYRRRNEGLIDLKLALVVFGGNFVGVRLGASTLASLQSLGSLAFGAKTIAAVDYYLLWVFLVLLALITGWLMYDSSRPQKSGPRVGLFSHIKIPPYTEFPSLDQPRMSIPVVAYFGLALGFLTGLLGIGGGVIMLPALVYLVGMRTHCAVATSLLMVWLSALVATVTHAIAGNTDVLLVVPLLIGGTIGLQVGTNLSNKMGGAQLRRYFAFVVLAAVLLVASRLAAVHL